MPLRSFLEPFPVRATEGEVFLKYGMGQNKNIIYLCFYLLKKNKTIFNVYEDELERMS